MSGAKRAGPVPGYWNMEAETMPEPEKDEWRVWFQKLPLDIHLRWKVQLRRIAHANGIAPGAWDADDKFAEQATGARVMTMEALLILLERSEDISLRV
jgi:hypothetical protein